MSEEIIFVHGWATDGRVWNRYAEKLAEGREFLCIDLPGHGGDKENGSWDEPTLRPAVDSLMSSLPSSGEVIGVGWSLGAQALMAAAAEEPEKFKGLVLVGGTPCFMQRKNFPWALSKGRTKKLLDEVDKDHVKAVKRYFLLNFTPAELRSPAVRELLQHYGETETPMEFDDIKAASEALIATDLRDRLRSIKTPTLIVHGALDEVCPVGAAEYLADNIAGAELQVFEGAGHAPFITEPERFKKTIAEFLEKL
ncbi:MAG: alpha/beta fold hydrolase [Thermodesulfobacteriota bacterium]